MAPSDSQNNEARRLSAVASEPVEEEAEMKFDMGLLFGFCIWLLIVSVGYWGYRTGLLLMGA